MMAREGRLGDGRFASGNSFSPGNPNARRMHELRRAIYDAATEDDVKAVIKALGDSAKGGDTAACKVFLEFVVGKPVTPIEVSGPDGGSVNLTGIVSKIMVALADYPEARYKVAAALHEVEAPAEQPTTDISA